MIETESNRPVTTPSPDSQSTPVSSRYNRRDQWDGTADSPENILKAMFGSTSEGEGQRPAVLSHQVPACVGEATLTAVSLAPLYQYHRDTEQLTAWRIAGTTSALIRYQSPDRDIYMIPPLGETQRDLFWMLSASEFYEIQFTLTYLNSSSLEFLIKTTRPRRRHSTERMLYDALKSAGKGRIRTLRENPQ